jgi:hypothetical protein
MQFHAYDTISVFHFTHCFLLVTWEHGHCIETSEFLQKFEFLISIFGSIIEKILFIFRA